ncbi:MAG TPA: hypothetical protein VGO56_21850 [Pyrinomonadaceae bacterium]|nr:hypothetical protein [Pyrinomonadaceae bacterium]
MTASGQSIIGTGVASTNSDFSKGAFGLRFEAVFDAECPPRFAQQSCDECIEAQADPEATMVVEFAGEVTSVAAEALTICSQPSRQPAPAIQKATVKASATRISLIEESSLIG